MTRTYHSYKKWAAKGYHVNRGEKAHWVDNKPVFYLNQVSKHLKKCKQVGDEHIFGDSVDCGGGGVGIGCVYSASDVII